MMQVRCWLEVRLGSADINQVRAQLDEADAIFRNLSNKSGLAVSLDTRALAEALYGEVEVAKDAILKALNLIGNQESGIRAKLLITSAQVNQVAGELEAAKQQLLQAREILANVKASRAEAKSWRQMADIYEELGDKESVIACLKASTDLLGLGSSTLVVR